MKDLLLRGATVIDPSRELHNVGDILVSKGGIRQVPENLDVESCTVMDLPGLFITPGWIDIHVHAYWGVSHYGIDADPHCLHRGVTTAVDAGSAGAQTFPAFRRYVIGKSRTRLFAMLNISSQGMLTREVGELEDIRYADVASAVAMCGMHPRLLRGRHRDR